MLRHAIVSRVYNFPRKRIVRLIFPIYFAESLHHDVDCTLFTLKESRYILNEKRLREEGVDQIEHSVDALRARIAHPCTRRPVPLRSLREWLARGATSDQVQIAALQPKHFRFQPACCSRHVAVSGKPPRRSIRPQDGLRVTVSLEARDGCQPRTFEAEV
jgi:hypothetical protein